MTDLTWIYESLFSIAEDSTQDYREQKDLPYFLNDSLNTDTEIKSSRPVLSEKNEFYPSFGKKHESMKPMEYQDDFLLEDYRDEESFPSIDESTFQNTHKENIDIDEQTSDSLEHEKVQLFDFPNNQSISDSHSDDTLLPFSYNDFSLSQKSILTSTQNSLMLSNVTPRGTTTYTKLRSVAEIPENYRSVFNSFPYFNIVQSKVFDDVFYSDKPVVVCAPTGSGKTVIFELAIIRFLIQLKHISNYKIVYMAPIKAVCSERHNEWKKKFGPLGLHCVEITGDSELDDYFELQKFSILLTTPEKWDGLTRRLHGSKSLLQLVRLFMIDEIHLLNDESRGATLEAVVSRMKTIQTSNSQDWSKESENGLRFLAISATIPNAYDITEWLSHRKNGATYKIEDDVRPVKLKRIVLGYPFHAEWSEFKFDLTLNYKLSNIINAYSERKPTLVFCSTRKGVIQTASILSKEAKFIYCLEHKQLLVKEANMLRDSKLRDTVFCGIGFHHAGLDVSDRRIIEELFVKGQLPVLTCTSTLAMGVNFPAHLVIIKSTTQYRNGCYVEYSEMQIVQMMGRAGRPQYDTTATVVIMTKHTLKAKYESLVSGTQIIESNLHKHLVEHLNAEIVLHTITDVSVAMEWIRSTFLYIRVMKNPKHYGIPAGLTKEQIEKKLQEMCLINLNALTKYKIITMDDDCFDLKPTEIGNLMAKYCTQFETMKQFAKVTGKETIKDLINLICGCKEFEDILLRTNEKKTLNALNKNKNKATIRYPISGKINTQQLKINCLIQATFGCLPITEASLNQDVLKIMQIGQRLSKCLLEYLNIEVKGYNALLNAVILSKCFRARLWENSKYISRQLDRIGLALSDMLVTAGVTTFEAIEKTNPRELEMILNRHPPFGNYLHDAATRLPKYDVTVEQGPRNSRNSADLCVTILLKNYELLQEKRTAFANHSCLLLIGDDDNRIILKQRIMDSLLVKTGEWSKKFEVQREENEDIKINLISEYYVGLDKQNTYCPFYLGKRKMAVPSTKHNKVSRKTAKTEKTCNHFCWNQNCAHDCCKQVKVKPWQINQKFKSEMNSKLTTSPLKRIKVESVPKTINFKPLDIIKKFSYSSSASLSNNKNIKDAYGPACITISDNDSDFSHADFSVIESQYYDNDYETYNEINFSDNERNKIVKFPDVSEPNSKEKPAVHKEGKVLAWKLEKNLPSRKIVPNASSSNSLIQIQENKLPENKTTSSYKDAKLEENTTFLLSSQWVSSEKIDSTQENQKAEEILNSILEDIF